MTAKQLVTTHLTVPVWLTTIIIMIFVSLIGYVANSFEKRFDRIERNTNEIRTMLFTHINKNDVK